SSVPCSFVVQHSSLFLTVTRSIISSYLEFTLSMFGTEYHLPRIQQGLLPFCLIFRLILDIAVYIYTSRIIGLKNLLKPNMLFQQNEVKGNICLNDYMRKACNVMYTVSLELKLILGFRKLVEDVQLEILTQHGYNYVVTLLFIRADPVLSKQWPIRDTWKKSGSGSSVTSGPKDDSSMDKLSVIMSGLSSAETTPAKKVKSPNTRSSPCTKKLFSEDEDVTFVQRGSRSYLNQDEVDLMETLNVTAVPPTPVGPVKYAVDYNEKDPLAAVTDNWNWDCAQPCKRKGFCSEGRRTSQTCRWLLEIAEVIACSARKYVENDRCHKEMTVIYIGKHNCNPRVKEKKPSKKDVEDILRTRPTITTGQIQIDTVREVLLSGKDAQEVHDLAMTYSNKTHLSNLRTSINNKARPGGSDIEAVRLLQDDFTKRGLDKNLILKVGDDFVILSSEHKLRLGALITLGLVEEPVSLDGCESHAKDFTEVEMTTYYPVLRRNVKLPMVSTFDDEVNKIIPSVAHEYGIDPEPYIGIGLDPHSYVGDEGGALWSGLCKAKGDGVKSKTISDAFHVKQDIRRHLKYFKSKKDQERFQSLMSDACKSPTSIQADEAEKALDDLIRKKSTDPVKMSNFKKWWWRRRARWQQWCKTNSASSAEVANAKSLSASGFRKRLLDVVTTECSAAILEAAEIKRQLA
ncbi:Hypothetical predicted protein, partial [Paramuricea clavata]